MVAAVAAVINAVAITLLEIVISPTMVVIIAEKKGILVVIVKKVVARNRVINVVNLVTFLVNVIQIRTRPGVTSVANKVIKLEIVMQIKITMINIIQDMDLEEHVIVADSTVIYHAIALIMEAAAENVINVDKKVIMRVIVQNMVTEVTMVVVENVLNVEIMDILPRIVKMKIMMVNGV